METFFLNWDTNWSVTSLKQGIHWSTGFICTINNRCTIYNRCTISTLYWGIHGHFKVGLWWWSKVEVKIFSGHFIIVIRFICRFFIPFVNLSVSSVHVLVAFSWARHCSIIFPPMSTFPLATGLIVPVFYSELEIVNWKNNTISQLLHTSWPLNCCCQIQSVYIIAFTTRLVYQVKI